MANKRNTNEVRLLGVARRGRAALVLTTALQASAMMVLSLPGMAQPPAPNAQPQGGVTVAGSATISQTATSTTINQTSQRAALNWQSFNVGSQQTVNFQQPSSSAVALNRVVGPDPSQIAGRINANGQVVLVNQSGVVFTQGAQVNAAGLMVSTAGITNQNFMAGTMKFDQPGNPNARIENAGNITVKQAGLAALVAPQVANSGTITATLGHVVLAGAKTATLDMYGDGLVALDVTNQVTQVPVAADGTKATALVTNTGTILAAGGTVQLTARAADGIVQTLVNAGGKISTPTVGNSTGTIALNAIGGTVIVEGQLSATGDAPGSTGGAVGVLATNGVGIAAGATIDVSGNAGGGVAAIGTTLARAKGGPSVKNPATARNVVVQQGATIKADATVKGNGGRVTVLSGNVTRMDGAITAKGGPRGGNGGFVEVSGNTLGITTGSLDVSAPQGTAGTILFDPIFLDIDQTGQLSVGTEDQNFFNNGGTILADDGKTGTPDTLSASAFGQISGDVLLQAQQTISVNASFGVNLGSLTLQAGSRITVNAGASVNADGDITFQIVPSLGTPAGTPLISILAPVTAGGSVALLASPGGSVNIGAAGSVTAGNGPVTIQADSLTVASGAASITATAGNVEIAPATTGAAVTLGGLGGLGISQTALTALSADTLVVGAVTLAGTLTTTAGSIAVTGPAVLPAAVPALSLNATGAVTEATTGALNVAALFGNTGPVSLVAGTNTITRLSAYTVTGGDFAMTDTTAFIVSSELSAAAGNVYLESASADGITIGPRIGRVTTAATGRASFQTDRFIIDEGGTVGTGTFELAPDTLGNTLEPGVLSPAGLTAIASTFVRLGAVTEPGNATPTIRAGEVLIASNFDFLNRGVELDASGPIDASGGTLTNVATLGGSGTTWTLTNTANTVGILTNIAATNFTLDDSSPLAINGAVVATTDATIVGTGSVTVNGSLTGTSVFVEATTLSVPGLLSAGPAGTIDISAGAGGFVETGTLVAGTLTGESSGTTDLTGANTVATIRDYFSQGFTMNDTGNLSVTGNYGLFGATSATIDDAGTLTVVASVSANAVALTANAIGITGLITNGGTPGNVALFATAGGISETGSIFTTTLSGSATGAVTLTGSNTVPNLGNFSAAGFTLSDTGDLTIGGSTGVSGGASASITASGALTVNSSVSATSVGLFATGGAITEPGAIVAGTLTGSATGAATLTGTNTVATVGNFTASGFTLTDTGNLAVGGTTGVSGGGSAQITTSGELTVTSTVSATSVGLTGAAIAINGLVTDGGTGSIGLTATAGGITETGTLISGDLSGGATGAVALTGSNTITDLGPFQSNGFTLFATGDLLIDNEGSVSGNTSTVIVDTGTLTVDSTVGGTAISLNASSIQIYALITDGGAGTVSLVATAGDVIEPFGEGISGEIVAGTLSGSATGSVDLGGFNTIAVIGNVTALNGFNLFDTVGLAVGGTTGIAGGTSAIINTSGTLTVTSSIGAGTVDVTATSVAIAGLVSAGTTGGVTVNAIAGGIAGTGSVVAGTFGGLATGAVNLTGGNTIATVGGFSAAGFTLHDTGNLTVAGTSGIEGNAGATIVDTGTLTVQSAVRATAISLTGGAIAIPGLVTDGGTGTVALIATAGTISETGALTAGTLSGSASGTTSLTGSNTVAAISNFAGNGVTLDDSVALAAGTGVNGLNGGAGGATILDSGALTVDGVFGASIKLTANSIVVPGALGAAGSDITLSATTGAITGAGTVIAATLAITSSSNTSLTGTNTIAALGNVTAADFTLTDTGNLDIAGTTGVTGGFVTSITTTGTLTVTSAVSAQEIGLTGAGIAIDGLVTNGGTGDVTLTATAGGIAETGTLVSGSLSGSATGAAILTGSNTIQTLADFSAAGFTLFATGGLEVSGNNGVVSTAGATISAQGALTVLSGVSGTSVSLTGASLALDGLVTDGGAGSVSLTATGGDITQAEIEGSNDSLIAGTLTGSATGAVALTSIANSIRTLNGFTAGGDLSLTDTPLLTVTGLVSAGSPSAPAPANTATLTLTATGGLQLGVADGASATLSAGTISLIASSAIGEPNGTLAANDLTAQTNGPGGDITLGSATNQIAASSGITATNGDVALVDDPTLVLTGPYSGNNLFFEVNLPGGSIAVGGTAPATLTVTTGGRITLIADGISATAGSTMTAPQGTIELAPFSAIAETVLGPAAAGTLNLDATLLAVVDTGLTAGNTLVLGAATGSARLQGGATQTIRAASLTIDGTLSLGAVNTTLGLLANGPIAESGGAVTVGTLFGNAVGGDFTLASPNNAIATASGITATNIVLVDGTDLTLTGLHSGSNEFYEVAAAGGTLTLGLRGQVPAPASLQATNGGRISLVADTIAASGGSAIDASGGTVELAPFSAINVSLLGTNGLAIGLPLLSAINTATLLAGGFTDAAAGATTSHVAAASVSVDGTTDLTGIATALVLDAAGAITQPGGPLIVAQLSGTGGSVSLLNPANAIGTVAALSATAGNLSLADTGTLGVTGAVSATGNVYLTANAVALAATGQIAATTGLASIQADSLTLATGATVTTGTFEFAPLTVGSTVTLGPGGALASLVGVDPTLARIGAVTLPGDATPTTTAGAIVVGATFDAAALDVELDATGAITAAAAPLINVAALSGSGGAWNLTALTNSVATLGAITASGFQLNDATPLSVAGVVSAGQAAFITATGALTVLSGGAIDATAIGLQANALTLGGKLDDGGAGVVALVATAGGITQSGTLTAGTLSGSATGAALFGGTNTIATLGDFTSEGLTLSDTRNLTVGGTTGVQAGPSAIFADNGTLTVASPLAATAITLAATSLSLPGRVTDGGAGTVSLVASGGITQTGVLVAGTLTGATAGTATLGGANAIATLGSFTAANFALTDDANLLISGALIAPRIAIQAPNSQITLGSGASIVTGGGTRAHGAIVAADEPANGAPGAFLLARTFAQTGASFVTGTMQVGVTGNIAFDPNVGLQDTNGWLILNLTNGRATGDIFVQALDVSYTTPGSAALTGRIAGVSGQGAAALASITPAIDIDFTFNGCTIGTVTCTIVTPPPPITPITPIAQGVQAQSPPLGNLALVQLLYTLQNIIPQVLLSPQDFDDLLQLPVVSEQDY